MSVWIQAQAIEKGKQLDQQACQYLIKQIGPDPALLQNELDKLICYVGDRPTISAEDISAICSSIPIENAWQLGDALFRRDAASALRICKSILNSGTPFFSLLRQLRHQFQTDFQVCSILCRGGHTDEITQQFPYMKGYVLERHVRAAQMYGMESFRKAILNIDAMELMAKNSSGDHDFLADLLIVKLTG